MGGGEGRAASGPLRVLQVYRDDERGRAAARGVRDALATERRVDLVERAVPAGAPLSPDILSWRTLRRSPAAVVLWLPLADLATLAALPPPGPRAPDRLFLSWTLLGETDPTLPAAWLPRTFVTYPFTPPGNEGPHGYRTRAWLRSRGISGDATAAGERHRLTAHWTLSLADHALAQLGATVSRDAFVEAVEREAEREPNPGVYPRLSLGPGQRVASKSCAVLPLGAATARP